MVASRATALPFQTRGPAMQPIPLLLAAAAALTGLSAGATAINVNNHSFEASVLAKGTNNVGIVGWVNSTGGAFHPNIGPTGSFSNPVPDGVNTAWLNGGSATQQLAATLAADTTYTLMVEVGDRRDNVFPGYSVALLAGGTVLASESALKPNDGFLTSVVSYTTAGSSPLFGRPLAIRLTANATQVNFDNVRLDASPVSAVPEPGIWALLMAGIGVVARRCRSA